MNHLIYRPRTWNAFAEWDREMDRFFDGLSAREVHAGSPACDIEETDDHYLISVDMPGVPKDRIKIEFQDQQLVVSGERRVESEKKENGRIYSERRHGKLQRVFQLPPGIQSDRAEAHHEDGVIRVYLPKAQLAKPRELKISSSPETGFFGKLLGSATSKKEGLKSAHSSSEVA